ncbi:PQQ-dependent sugar dehydrogenase [Streptomyces sp. NPDC051940]|uniref:PQQ-dependent sugar dehydrogenase n=1 Tax=Streptomyces sp. NPDC051940 TaxID=3155675 RepID=UPI0034424A82
MRNPRRQPHPRLRARSGAGLVALVLAVLAALLAAVGPAAAAPTRYEAESAVISQGVVESNHAGYSGTGFVNGDNVTGSYVEFTVTAATAGTATIGIRHANGTTIDRPMAIAVNGTTVATPSFPGTGAWTNWVTHTVTAPVTAGTNKIRLTATTVNGGPNLDFLDVEVARAFTDYQAENGVMSSGTVDSNHAGFTGSGFVNLTNAVGSYLELTVNSGAAATVDFEVRFANGGSVDRPMAIAVNGTTVVAAKSFPVTGAWTTWQDATFSAALTAGDNTIRLTANTADGGPNLDRLRAYIADTTPPTRPGQPGCANITDTTVDLSWGASTDDTGVAAYDIYKDGNKISEAAGSATSKQLTGLTPDTAYDLTVIARDGAGNVSLASPNVICRTLTSDTSAPTAPASLSPASNVTATTANLSWGASSDDRGVTEYQIRPAGSTSPLGKVTGSPPATSLTVSALSCNTSYTVVAVALDAARNVSAASNSQTFTTGACSDPDGGFPQTPAQISSNWTIPWGMSFLPNQTNPTALVTERDHFRVWKVTATARTQVGTVPNSVTTDGEGGLMGVAPSPTWNGTTDKDVFFMHTASEGNRIAKMQFDGTTLSGYTQILGGIAKNRYHNGGTIAFGPDGYLYVATGDAQSSSNAQNLSSLNGKILRITKTGAAAPGNPFGTRVFSYGHRNPQGLAFDRNGRLWEAELGNSTFDELNLIKSGNNYGWPTCEGSCSVSGMTNPKKTWSVSEASPAQIAIVRNVIYMTTLRGQRLWRIPITGDTESVGSATSYWVGTYGRLRAIATVPGASQFWMGTTNADNNGGQPDGSDRLYRVTIQ